MMTDVFILGETDENCIRNDDIKTDMDLPASRECTFFVAVLNLTTKLRARLY